MNFLKSIAVVLFLMNFFIFYGQNIVPNGGFESYSVLPDNYCQWNRSIGWSNVNGAIGCTSSGSPDYFHNNATSSVTLPNTSSGTNINPNTGDAIMGFLTWSGSIFNNFREYLSIQLTQSMVAGQSYQVSFYLSNGNTPYYGYGSNNIGLHFSNSPLSQASNEVINVVPQIEITSIFYSSTWELFTFTFVPTANYSYITFGNFRDDANTQAQMYYNSTGRAYYFIDDVSIIPAQGGLSITGNQSICLGDSTTLFASGDSNSSYNWAMSSNPGTIISSDSIVTVSPISTTNYLLYGTNDTISYTVTVSNSPSVDLGADTVLCPGEILILDATTNNANYLWQDNSTNPSFTVTQSGTYWVEVDVNNCNAMDSIVVLYNFSMIDLGNDTNLCQGESIILDATIPNAEYLWQDNSNSSVYTVTQAGTYWVEVTTNGCSSTDSIVINYSPIPNLFLGNDTSLCYVEPWTLSVSTPNANYLWQDNSTNSTFSITQTGTYWVELNLGACSVTDSIVVSLIECDVSFAMPNVFTPNNDATNDFFQPIENSGITKYSMTIVNRWGLVVFESNDLIVNWDGMYKGMECSEGVYFWVINYETIYQDNQTVHGFVELLK